jgi:DNA-damage-inducible protein D
MTPTEYKKHKGLPEKSKANLRDHMTDLELIFTMLGEQVTTEISKQKSQKVWLPIKRWLSAEVMWQVTRA